MGLAGWLLTTDEADQMVERLTDSAHPYRLQTFNSRTCQLVLGAGAMAAAGLKSITAKHLAMSAQAAGAARALLAPLRALLAAHVPPSRRALLVPEFDHLLQVRQCAESAGTKTYRSPDPSRLMNPIRITIHWSVY